MSLEEFEKREELKKSLEELNEKSSLNTKETTESVSNSTEKDRVPHTNNVGKERFIGFSIIGFIATVAFVSLGFYKMFVYENYGDSDYLSSYSKNAYVGGDAYNYIINGTYTTAYFILALMSMVFACTMLILGKMHQR
ncbi:hypothetical protein [Metasolibacillus meyeri]|uniref:hypothetical protein n=1 Tax=Metasolibacillus meyeri TaxID=1071052 RepID=UPI00193113D0|nr:hypothetical protein [Metasolibacillus meyeri]